MEFSTLTKTLDITALMLKKMHSMGLYSDEQYNECMNCVLKVNEINETVKEDFDNFMYEVTEHVDTAWKIAKEM